MLDRLDNDWPAVLRNIRKARQVWGRIGKFLRREGAEPAVSENNYRAVVQAVLLFGADTWVLLAPMMKRLEEVHVGFLQQVTQKKSGAAVTPTPVGMFLPSLTAKNYPSAALTFLCDLL